MHSLPAPDHLAVVDLNGPGHYLQWGILQVSAANLTVILAMIAVFVLALVLPFPGGSAPTPTGTAGSRGSEDAAPTEAGESR